jgi:hypothetical protein
MGIPEMVFALDGVADQTQRHALLHLIHPDTFNPVMAFDLDGKLVIAGSFAGADVDPAWLHNLRAHPHAHIEIGTDAYDVQARELPRARHRCAPAADPPEHAAKGD